MESFHSNLTSGGVSLNRLSSRVDEKIVKTLDAPKILVFKLIVEAYVLHNVLTIN